jgi:hypothetical protein
VSLFIPFLLFYISFFSSYAFWSIACFSLSFSQFHIFFAARKVDTFIAICDNAGASTSRNPMGLHGRVGYSDNFTFIFSYFLSLLLFDIIFRSLAL